MSTIIPPILPIWGSDLIMAVVSLFYGIYWERYYTPWASVVLNIVFTAIFLGSNGLPTIVFAALLGYLIIGLIVAFFGVSQLKDLFGTKAFGALTLTASLGATGFLDWFAGVFSPINAFFSYENVFMVSWVGIGIIAYVLGWYYFGRKTDSDKKWKKKK